MHMFLYEAVVTDSVVTIKDSYLFSKNEFPIILNDIEDNYPDNPVMLNRSRFGMKMEWATHNALYNMNIERERTRDVDLEYP